jgi:hypothetical protein
MDAVQILYFVDTDTGELRGTCPSTNGRLLDTWGARRDQFRQSWDALSKLDRSAHLAAAVDMLTSRPLSAPLNFPRRYARGSRVAGAAPAIYRPVARASEALPKPLLLPDAPGYDTVLLLRIMPDAVGGQAVFWWASMGDLTWIHSNEEPR